VKGIAAFLLLAFALVVLWLRYVTLPNVDNYRDRVVRSLSQSTGMQVGARSLSGGWEGLRPYLSLAGFVIKDKAGRVALGFERAEVTLSWWSLFTGRVEFNDVEFYRPALALRRTAQGRIYLGDLPLNDPNAPEDGGQFTAWLLDQPRLYVHDASLTWRDEAAQAPEMHFDGVEITLRKRRGRHHAALTARPSGDLARAIDMRADLKLTQQGSRWVPDGDAYFEARDADLGLLRMHVPVPETLKSGAGNLRVWMHVNGQGLTQVVADVAMRDARAQLAQDAAPLEIGRASCRERV